MNYKLLLTTLLLAATSGAQAENIFRRGNDAEPASMDPQLAQGMPEMHILRDMFVGLVDEDAGAHLIPGHPEHTHAQRGHLDAIVEGNHLWTFLTGFAFTLQADQPILREMLVLSRPTPVCWWRGEDREIEV